MGWGAGSGGGQVLVLHASVCLGFLSTYTYYTHRIAFDLQQHMAHLKYSIHKSQNHELPSPTCNDYDLHPPLPVSVTSSQEMCYAEIPTYRGQTNHRNPPPPPRHLAGVHAYFR